MKTTVEIADGLLREAKKRAVDEHKSLRALIEEGLRLRLGTANSESPVRIRWVVAEGGVPDETSDRVAMRDWLERQR